MSMARTAIFPLIVLLSACSSAPVGSDIDDSQLPDVADFDGEGCGEAVHFRRVSVIRATAAYDRGGLDEALRFAVAKAGPFVTDPRGPLLTTSMYGLRQDASKMGCDIIVLLQADLSQRTAQSVGPDSYGVLLGRTLRDK